MHTGGAPVRSRRRHAAGVGANEVRVPARDRPSRRRAALVRASTPHRSHQHQRSPRRVREDERFRPASVQDAARARLRRALRVEVVHRPIACLPRSPVRPVTGARSSIEVPPPSRLRLGDQPVAQQSRTGSLVRGCEPHERILAQVLDRPVLACCGEPLGTRRWTRAPRGLVGACESARWCNGNGERRGRKKPCDRGADQRGDSPHGHRARCHFRVRRHGSTIALPSRLRLSGAP